MPLAATRLGSLVEQHRDAIIATVRLNKGRRVAVFGSVARGEDGPDSDIDLLVEFEAGSSLLDMIRLEDALRELLGCGVDVVSAGALLDRDDDIRRDLVPL
ncbi:MAG: nucleotidyltransferase family protein [Ilumatobacteraceae bacterium]